MGQRNKRLCCGLFALTMLVFPLKALAAAEEPLAKAYVLLEAQSGRVLKAKNPHSRLPMASTTKIMTCLIALERGNLEEMVTVGKNAAGAEGSSMYLAAGEKRKLIDLLYGLMMNSGNDAAIAIAEHIGKSVAGFAELMNKKAEELGAVNTHFVTPNGLHNEEHFTTAYDLALISAAAMRNPVFRMIVNTQNLVLPETDSSGIHYLHNKNKILWQVDGGNGIKTGYTKIAGKCLSAAALRDDMQLIAVVLNDSAMFDDCKSLLEYGFQNYKMIKVLEAGTSFGEVFVSKGAAATVSTAAYDEISLPLTEEECKIIEEKIILTNELTAPVEARKPVGQVQYMLNGKEIAQANLYAQYAIPKNDLGYRLRRVLDRWLFGWRGNANSEIYGGGGSGLETQM